MRFSLSSVNCVNFSFRLAKIMSRKKSQCVWRATKSLTLITIYDSNYMLGHAKEKKTEKNNIRLCKFMLVKVGKYEKCMGQVHSNRIFNF